MNLNDKVTSVCVAKRQDKWNLVLHRVPVTH